MRTRFLASLTVAAIAAAPLAAQAAAKPAAAPVGFRAEFIQTFDAATKKYIQLAEAIPADKYTWRPPGARSIAEVFIHIANAQYLFGTSMGWPAPAGIDAAKMDSPTAETWTTDKAKIIETMKASFAWYRAGVMAMPDADANKTAKFFGQTLTMRAFLLEETGHNGEHLGQMIAYARMNGVVPPWSMPAAGTQ